MAGIGPGTAADGDRLCKLPLVFLVQGRNVLAVARGHQDRLFGHFRALVEGIKELKLHAQRQQAFMDEELTATAHQLRRSNRQGLSYFAVLDSWGKFIYFFCGGGGAVFAAHLDGFSGRNPLRLCTHLYLSAGTDGKPGEQAALLGQS